MQIMIEFFGHEIANAAEQMQKLNVSPETQMEELQGILNADPKLNSL